MRNLTTGCRKGNTLIVNTIVNFLGNPPGNRKRKNEDEKDEEEDDGAEGGGEDVQLRLQVKHPGLR